MDSKEKETVLLKKARDLSNYTRKITKIRTSEVDANKVAMLLDKIIELDSLEKVKESCSEISEEIKHMSKPGFSKSSFNLYGKDMRESARNIVKFIGMANEIDVRKNPEKRIEIIFDILGQINLLIADVQTCHEEGIISLKTSEFWTKQIMDIKYMTLKWKKTTEDRANEIESNKLKKEYTNLFKIIEKAFKEVLLDNKIT